jgi:hypothetical protein
MKSFKRLFSAAPEGTAALFFIQIFATLGFAVLYSTLVLYATKHLHLGVKAATTLMGVFGAFKSEGKSDTRLSSTVDLARGWYAGRIFLVERLALACSTQPDAWPVSNAGKTHSRFAINRNKSDE